MTPNRGPVSAKDQYEEAGRVHRYFLGWRQAMFLGYVAAYYALLTKAFDLCHLNQPSHAGLLLVAGSFLGIVLLVGDLRSRELYGRATRAATMLEHGTDPAPKPDSAEVGKTLYERLNLKPTCPGGSLGPHTLALVLLYTMGSGVLLGAGVVLLTTTTNCLKA